MVTEMDRKTLGLSLRHLAHNIYYGKFNPDFPSRFVIKTRS